MKSLSKLIAVVVIFSTLFFLLRFYGHYAGYDVDLLVADLGGLAYLYSTVGTIFAIFAAFVIVSESQDWRTLNTASKDEVRALNELLMWAKGLSRPLAESFSMTIRSYLETVIDKEWNSLREGKSTPQAEFTLSTFHDLLLRASTENADIAARMSSSFNEFLNKRALRIEYSWQPLPTILKFTVYLVDFAVIGLSLFIGVRNPWLDYIFMLCIVTLGAVILIVVDDLDNPLRPGEWYLTSGDHQRLLSAIR